MEGEPQQRIRPAGAAGVQDRHPRREPQDRAARGDRPPSSSAWAASARSAGQLVRATAAHTTVKRALLQNAFAAITAKIRYRSPDGREAELDANFTRYEVHFAGERLPDGREADAVYLVLGATYRRILDTALTRPLDYAYLQDLPPRAQRLYEVASYRMFAALKHHRPRARLGYAEFCVYAPQTRYTRFGPMREADGEAPCPPPRGQATSPGSSSKPRPTATGVRLGDGYMPGPKAQAEYQAFTRKGGPVAPGHRAGAVRAQAEPEPEPEPTGLEKELVERGVTQAVAADLVRDFPADRIRRQIEVVDWLRETKPKRVKDLGAYLAEAIRKDFAPPAGFRSRSARAEAEATVRAQREQEEQARQAKARARGRGAGPGVLGGACPPTAEAARGRGAGRCRPGDRAAYEAATGPARRLLQVGLRDAHIRRLLGLPAAD